MYHLFNETKLLIVKATEELLEKQPIEKISVSTIMKKCGMSRQTFYNHFYDKFDLIIFLHLYKTITSIKKFQRSKNFICSMTDSFKLMQQNRTIYLNLSSYRGQNSFEESYFEFLIGYSIEHIGENRLSLDESFIHELYWHGVTSMVLKWFKDDMAIEADKLGELIYKSMPEAIQHYYV
ncbi:TetR/AcrR family transcriptional regulator C-terminal domain-containing protein [Vagococcus sp. BWB3-3]|uniref:TetR/AcrR family transcriptional regulator C-terminal domain-containing protein n=1 Tax=Vagococcus allomyrinae TaxID=2794353 RepID=A0A940P361_9ENTE|nr:TetR/AcrR family transcriptional regulator C-terminal domain-containing protein [Vagococcus allomyrinae]MBP1040175.1 TetR/AcrR family transcriptional regulator C-terminal domain-containing protein [Vagococcus allomyrinae]